MTPRAPAPDLTPLWERKASGCERARAELIERHASLVGMTRERVIPNVPDAIDREDLISEGYLALVRAVDRFDPARGVQFKSFAISHIRGSMLEYLRREDWVPRSVRAKQRQWETAAAQLLVQGEPATAAAMAAHLGLSADDYHHFQAQASVRAVHSLEAIIARDDAAEELEPLTLVQRLADPAPGPEAQTVARLEAERRHAALAGAFRLLPEPSRTLFRAYYGEGRTLKSIGQTLGRSETRAHQIRDRGLAKLRQALPAEVWG